MKTYSVYALSSPFEVFDREKLDHLCIPFKFKVNQVINSRCVRISCKYDFPLADENGWLQEHHFIELIRGLRPILFHSNVSLLINHAIEGELLRMDVYQISKEIIEHRQICIDVFFGFNDGKYLSQLHVRPVSLDDQLTDDLPF